MSAVRHMVPALGLLWLCACSDQGHRRSGESDGGLDGGPRDAGPGDGGLDDAGLDASWPDAGLEWVALEGGRYSMGSPTGVGEADEQPQHTVDLPDFEMTRSEVTVGQFAHCVAADACPEPGTDLEDGGRVYCNWGRPDRDDYPVNCLDWELSATFCQWVGGRLPSEAEWEYAARSRGRDIRYPWGDDEPSCERAIFNEGGVGCGTRSTWPVCSLPLGHSDQGICDLVGNVWEWVADRYHATYDGAPADGAAWEEGDKPLRSMRSGGIDQAHHENLRAANRVFHEPSFSFGGLGFRCTR